METAAAPSWSVGQTGGGIVSGDSQPGGPSAAPSPWPLSVYSVVLPRLTPAEAIDAVKAAGYDGILWRARSSSGPTALPIQVDGEHRCLLDPTPPEVMADVRRRSEHARPESLWSGTRLRDLRDRQGRGSDAGARSGRGGRGRAATLGGVRRRTGPLVRWRLRGDGPPL